MRRFAVDNSKWFAVRDVCLGLFLNWAHTPLDEHVRFGDRKLLHAPRPLIVLRALAQPLPVALLVAAPARLRIHLSYSTVDFGNTPNTVAAQLSKQAGPRRVDASRSVSLFEKYNIILILIHLETSKHHLMYECQLNC